ncbi:hypothetical protein FRC07_011105, partial [Ceratobasidium sp. 392]
MTAHSSPDIGELSAHSAQEDHHSPNNAPTEDDALTEPPPSPVPSYPHTPTPAYTSQPHTTEQTVTRGPPTAAELTAHIEYTTAKRFRVLFGGQQQGRTATQGPEYARGSKIRGVVHVVDKWREKIGSVDLKLVLPTPPLHPLSQPIPFHFQLSAECPPPTHQPKRKLSITSTSSKPPRSPTLTRNPPPPTSIPIALLAEPALLRLTIQRQISVDVRGARALRVMCGGVGRMERVVLGTGRRGSLDGRYEARGVRVVYEGQVSDGPGPPAYSSALRRTNSLRSMLSQMSGGVGVHYTGGAGGGAPPGVERVRDRDGGRECFAIAWEGSVVPEREVLQVGGFRAGGLLIKDFVTLTLVPPTPELSPLRALQQAVP